MSNGMRAPTFAESVAIENYQAAMKDALASANSLADKVVTAAFSVATAFGAVIALVAPKDTPSSLLVVLPFVALASAVGLALYAQSLGIGIEPTNDLETVRERISNTIEEKRKRARWALVALVIGMILAGYVLNEEYGQEEEEDGGVAASVWLTPAGSDSVALACDDADVAILRGEVEGTEDVATDGVSVKVDGTACGSGGGTVVLTPSAIRVIKLSSEGASGG